MRHGMQGITCPNSAMTIDSTALWDGDFTLNRVLVTDIARKPPFKC